MLIYAQWAEMNTESQRDLINHLKIICDRKLTTEKEIRFIREICLPVLIKAEGEINDNMDFLNRVQSYGYMPADIGKIIAKHHEYLLSWVNTKEASKHMGCSVRSVQKLAKLGPPFLEVQRITRGWRINPVSINDFMLRTRCL